MNAPTPLQTPGPLTVAYGMGVDSTAILVGLHQAGERPDLITWADTGSEKQVTIDYLPTIQAWLKSVGFPPLTIVRYQPKEFKHWPPYSTLYENSLTNSTLPSLAFGFQMHSCSSKWKIQPQLQWIKHEWPGFQQAQAAGQKITRCIGYDCTETRRINKASDRNKLSAKWAQAAFHNRYPLIEWGWDRNACIAAIQNAGLTAPAKSACFFCPASKPHELHDLTTEELRKIIVMEKRAAEKCHTIHGLWCKPVKGTRGATPRPGDMTTYIRDQALLPEAEITRLQQHTPTTAVTKDTVPNWSTWLDDLFQAAATTPTLTELYAQLEA